jgi:hypothetical protein
MTGLPGKGRLVNFDYMVFSTTTQNFTEIGKFKVLDFLGQQLQEGSCRVKLASKSIQFEGFGDQATVDYKIQTESVSILRWLATFTGLFDDRIRSDDT